ncbi:AI-2E family transporter [Oscillatoria amoena NRMC-F 0135]|uniref:AI-2E family transporter n=1 Tax=Geitlerinema calcuttense NRMC-F 0142 TaxID=2922238 RepID=A0ABT7LZC1_9CYAN|nr:AI-2E family transporter [Geitlerinema calcuttense]MDI9638767.1 AI-2E family transporter [Geitlerinema splendidum]MDL5045583.1 AI-2E family transporter [Oscillatoria amoena NRMC-F 0135]MDL5056465.1 AI-2E family transporter [Geitlerinema calcuttense NRMC-F 0142]
MVNPGSSTPKSKLLQWWEAFTPLSRLLAIALAAPLAVLNAWALSEIFGYFESLFVILLVAALLAFLLNYPVSWLEKQGAKRGQAAVLVFLCALLILLGLGLTLFPLALTQAQQLVARLPELIDSGQRQIMMLDDRIEALGLPISLDGVIPQINTRLKVELQRLAGQALNLTLSLTVLTVVRLLDVLLTVVLTFYLLQHSNDIWDSIIEWLPSRIQKPFSDTLRLSFQNYFIGQIILATCMGLGLTSLFLWLKVPFGLLFGLTVGLMALVPFGGTVGIITVTLLVALQNIGLALQVLAVSLIVQQIVENIIAPRVLGSVTGLNPFWVFVSILTGVRIGGLLGVIVAVPTAVVIKEALIAIRSVRKAHPPEDDPTATTVYVSSETPQKSEIH